MNTQWNFNIGKALCCGYVVVGIENSTNLIPQVCFKLLLFFRNVLFLILFKVSINQIKYYFVYGFNLRKSTIPPICSVLPPCRPAATYSLEKMLICVDSITLYLYISYMICVRICWFYKLKNLHGRAGRVTIKLPISFLWIQVCQLTIELCWASRIDGVVVMLNELLTFVLKRLQSRKEHLSA